MNSAIDAFRAFLPKNPTLVDVGAAKGDFTSGFLESFPDGEVLLFEPTDESVFILRERFRSNPRIKIFGYALGNSQGTMALHSYRQSENNSLLVSKVQDLESSANVVKVDTLDNCLTHPGMPSTIDAIKIDTQGTDLKVLQGARQTIEKHHPLVLAEAIFVPLYDGQDSYYDTLEFMRDLKYSLTGIYETHYTLDGFLAFGDLLFVHEEVLERMCKNRTSEEFRCADATSLGQQIRSLEQVCRDRLDLIEQLQKTAEERLDLINRLSAIASERLEVIRTLDTEVKKLKGGT